MLPTAAAAKEAGPATGFGEGARPVRPGRRGERMEGTGMKKRCRRLISALLTLAMLLSLLPAAALAAGETGTATKISTQEELTDGQYVMVVGTGYAVGALDGTWLSADLVTETDGTLTGPAANLVWTISVTDGGGVTLTDANGVQVAPKGGNDNGIKAGSYTWSVAFNGGTFRFLGVGADTVTLASNKSSGNKFRAYKNTTINAGYPCDFTLYKLEGGGGTVDPDPSPDPVQAPFADGDRVVIYTPQYSKALSADYGGGFYNQGTAVSVDGGVVSGFTDADVWTAIDNGDGTWSFSYNGQNIGMGDSFSSMPLGEKNDKWVLEDAGNGLYYIKNTVRGAYMEWYAEKNNWSSYNKISSGSESLFALAFYQAEGGDPGSEEPETVPISQALAAETGTENLTVKGVVTLLDGRNVYLQDATGGICARMGSDFSDIALGDTVIATGKRAVYNGLPQLGSATYEKSSGLTLTPAVRTIGQLTTADICTYVTLRNVEVTEVFDNGGKYTNPNITVTDGIGSIQLYKAVIGEKTDGQWPVKVGDTITVTAAVSVYDGTLQLRNTNIGEIDLDGTPAGPIYHGEQVVIYNPDYGKALSSSYDGYYNKGTDVTMSNGSLSGFTAAEVWTVIDNEDGTWSFSYNGQNIGMNADKTSMPLGGPNNKWELVETDNGLFYIKNTVRGAYMEWYAEKNNWSSYYKISSGSEPLFALAFYEVTEIPGPEPGEGLPQAGDTVVIYNLSSKGVLAGQDDNTESSSITSASATAANPITEIGNGARVFTVEQNSEWYRFKTAYDGYLCSNGTGNNAFYSQNATDDADWKLEAYNGGFTLESRTAKFNDKYSQFLEYYSGSYKTYSMYNVTDKDIYTFRFHPVSPEVNVTDGVVNLPNVVFGDLPAAYVGQEYTVTFTVDAVFGVQTVAARYGETDVTPAAENGVYSFTIPAADMKEGKLSITVSGTDMKNVPFSGSVPLDVADEPVIAEVTPGPNAQTGDDKRPEIAVTFANAGENPTVKLTLTGPSGTAVEAVDMAVSGNRATYTPAQDLAEGRYTASVTLSRTDGKKVERTWSFVVGTAQYQLYFGQLHSHTGEYSDGAGTLQEGLSYVASLPESANVDFVAFTDHSNYFDSTSAPNPEAALYNVSQMTAESAEKWNTYTGTIRDFNETNAGKLVALPGFEMTWSGGPGHINTFNTPGIVSRNNATLNSKTADAGMKAYYALLSNGELSGSISQFNHPGSTFGTFSDFAYYDALIDTRMYLVEVGNGEGAIGAGGYYPSYEYYIMALDKGWHVAPTNNQDNHKGKWGNANDARDVILTDDFSEEGLYQAIREYRVYATEDKNLEINYTLNGQMLGSIIEEVPEMANINVTVYDPDRTDSISRVEVVVNSGAVAYTWSDPAQLSRGELSCSIPAKYSYYFIRVIQGDGDIAVTAPVWVGDTLKLGISSVECGTATPVTGEELTITTTLFNSETADATIKSVTYTSGTEVLGSQTDLGNLGASSTTKVEWKYTPTTARIMPITVSVVLEQEGTEYTYTMDVTLDIQDASKMVYIGIDASHYNEYVAGNYKDSMGNFGNLAADYAVRTVQLNTTADLLAACENKEGKYKAIILTAPSRRDGNALRNPYATYSDAEIQALAAFNAAGGTLVVAGWGDYYESYAAFPADEHMAAQQNKILAALGSSLRISDDELKDDTYNGGQSQRLYLSSYNFDSFLLDRVEFDADHPHDNLYTELFSQYGGASIHVVDAAGAPTTTIPSTVTPVVYGFATSYSADDDKDNWGDLGEIPKYAYADGDSRLMVLATEQLPGKGLIVVSGAAFMSNFEVQAQVGDSGSEKNYSNYKICENLVNYLNPIVITPIAEVQAQSVEGVKYTIEGVVTSNASGFDKDTAFFDCIYLQDATAGINAFPVAGDFKVGDRVRITGTTSSYQGERQIAVSTIEKIGEGSAPTPREITAAQLNDGSVLGSLVTLKGTVESFEKSNGLVQTIMVRDSAGNVGRVFIDGYITTAEDVKDLKVGCAITATGLASYDNTFNAPDGPYPRIRIRNRADILCTDGSQGGGQVIPPYIPPYIPTDPKDPDITDPDTPLSPGAFVDLRQDAWYYADVAAIIESGLMNGISDTLFAPEAAVRRSELAAILYRLSGETSTASASFTDVPAGSWYEEFVAWASSAGVVNGFGDGSFRPNADISREQAVTMLYRYAQYKGLACTERQALTGFVDEGQVSGYAREAMEWAVAVGLIQGRSGQMIAPKDTILRCELCTVLLRFQKLLP